MQLDRQTDASITSLSAYSTEFRPSIWFPDNPVVGAKGTTSSPTSSLCRDVCQIIPVRTSTSGTTLTPAQPWNESKLSEPRREIRFQRQKRYVKKAKEVRQSLRYQVAELSALLDQLQRVQAFANAAVASKPALATWRAIAVRQKERRLESEAEQRKLRARVARQSELIHSMNELLQPSIAHSPVESSEVHSSSTTMLFKTLMQELNPLHALTDEVTADVEFKLSTLPMQFAMVRSWNEEMTFLESSHATIVPFGFDDTCRALSDALLTNPRGSICCDGILDTQGFKCRLDFSQELGGSVSLLKQSVTRRYIESDRVVFVSRMLTEGQGTFEGLYTNGVAWYVLRRPTDDSSMVLETYSRLMPVGLDVISKIDERGSEFMKALARADQDEVDSIIAMFERMLLDEIQSIL
ncbi:hypothetical protein AM587_10001887 [Phytophthora nicotianae]|uniref:Uncharacterized protein n=1 Tax=Phytophthora nicotianae TaxID=4792 RepID=A0A0W8CDX8_PHYNI|nr:hypothetical protein AM587_10001887 [Phytophthora nicotianae]